MEIDQTVEPPLTLIDLPEIPTDTFTTKNSGDTGTQTDTPEDLSSAPKNSKFPDRSTAAHTTLIQGSNGSESPPQTPSLPQTFQHSSQNLPEHHEYHLPSSDHTQTLPPHTSSQHHSPTTAEQNPIQRHLSDSSSLEVNNSSTHILDSTTTIPGDNLTKKTKKKAKINLKSNSSSSLKDKILEGLRPAEEIFSNNSISSPVSMLQFQYILENYTNKNINIHNLCKEIDSDIPSLMKLIEEIRPNLVIYCSKHLHLKTLEAPIVRPNDTLR